MKIPIPNRLREFKLIRAYDDKRSLLRRYQFIFGKKLDLTNPQTFTEKLFYRMIMVSQYGDPTFTRLADKFLVREYVQQKVGDKYLTDLLWSGVNPSEIPFDKLPTKYVIKANHASGKYIIVQGQFDRHHAIEIMNEWLEKNHHSVFREYQYYNIKPRILVEQFIDDGYQDGPLDYRFWCFGGRSEIIQIDNHVHSADSFYDVEWNRLQIQFRGSAELKGLQLHDRHSEEFDLPRPANLEEMLLIASKLSSEFDFVRVDLYNLNGKIKFGELTFTPRAGAFCFRPSSWDLALGRKWVMNNYRRNF